MSRHKHEEKTETDGLILRPSEPGESVRMAADVRQAEATDTESGAAAGSTFADEVEALKTSLAEAETSLEAARAEVAELNDKYLRKLADESNFRKRMMREKEDAQRYGISGLLGDLIPIMDDFDRAIASAETARNYDQLHDGIQLIRRQMSLMLENKYYLKRIPALGELFDPELHEAVAAVHADVPDSVVSEEFLPGYRLHDRVLRTAKVRVQVPAPRPAADTSAPAASPSTDGAAN